MTVSMVGLCISIDGLNDQQVRCFPSVGAKQEKKFRLLECFALVHDRQAATKARGQVLRVHRAAQRLDAAEVLCAL
jgi:hypothetical protein